MQSGFSGMAVCPSGVLYMTRAAPVNLRVRARKVPRKLYAELWQITLPSIVLCDYVHAAWQCSYWYLQSCGQWLRWLCVRWRARGKYKLRAPWACPHQESWIRESCRIDNPPWVTAGSAFPIVKPCVLSFNTFDAGSWVPTNVCFGRHIITLALQYGQPKTNTHRLWLTFQQPEQNKEYQISLLNKGDY